MRTYTLGNYTVKAFNSPCYAGEKNMVSVQNSASSDATVTLSIPTMGQTIQYVAPGGNIETLIDFSPFINALYRMATGASLAFTFTLAGISVSSTVYAKRRYNLLIPPKGVIHTPSAPLTNNYYFRLYSDGPATYSQANAQNVSFTDLSLQYGAGFQYLLFNYMSGSYRSLTRFHAVDNCALMGGMFLSAGLFDRGQLTYFFFIESVSDEIIGERYILQSDDQPRKTFSKRRTWRLTTGHNCDLLGKQYLSQFADAMALTLRHYKDGVLDAFPVRLGEIDEATDNESPFTLQVYQDLEH
ncbi:MAG: hypothetical protein MdMp024_1725 [Bacteroidales bacterium]